MGCVSSASQLDPSHQVFQVCNVDEEGRTVASGRLQVTPTELVFHRRSRVPITWPLRSLRRYGFDSELFSFECGRRCPTGPGIYAFKCRLAECLFNVLQATIQSPAMAELQQSEENGGGPLLSPAPEGPVALRYVNEEMGPLAAHASNCHVHRYTNSVVLAAHSRDCGCAENRENPFYVNVPPGEPAPLTRTSSQRARAQTLPSMSHSRTIPSEIQQQVYVNVAQRSSLEEEDPPQAPEEEDGINYIVLDLEHPPSTDPSPSPAAVQSPPPPLTPTSPPASTSTGGYATIDFAKTAALSSSILDHRARPISS